MGIEKEPLKSYAVVEMMGHRKIVGLVTESDISGGQLIRVDVLGSTGEPERTEYVGVGSIYCLTIVTEEVAKKTAQSYAPRPAWAYGLESRPDRQLPDGDDDDYQDGEQW